MRDPRIRSAARNNAELCHAVTSAHGHPGEFHDSVWINRHPVPRFYPNAVTLRETVPGESAGAISHIGDLAHGGLPAGWAVKDSFAMLDLGNSGFAPLFDAQWVVRQPGVPLGSYPLPLWRWTTIDSDRALGDWEAGWSAASEEPAGQPRVFAPALLRNRSFAIIAAYERDRIVAGAIANRSDDVVGLSNLFAPRALSLASAAHVISIVGEIFPRALIVDYANGAELEECIALGYEPLGPLRVWIRKSSA